MKNAKTLVRLFTLSVLGLALALGGCSLLGRDTGTLRLSVTDAPIVDEDSVTGVFVTFEEVQYHVNGEWETMDGFDGPRTINLLELTGGESELLGALSLRAGTYTQIRFIVAGEAEGNGPPSNTGTWINRDDNDTYDPGVDDPLFVPSGAQTGYKATADEPFTVPANGTVSITADFDLRRAVVAAGGFYILKPVIRLVVDDQAGTIQGDVTHTTGNTLVVFAYEEGEYDSDEPDGDNPFQNAVTSAKVEDDPEGADYVLAFLAAGDYDLVVAQYDPDAGDYISAAVAVSGVTVTAGEVTTRDLSL